VCQSVLRGKSVKAAGDESPLKARYAITRGYRRISIID
jgi:hypothetical protein